MSIKVYIFHMLKKKNTSGYSKTLKIYIHMESCSLLIRNYNYSSLMSDMSLFGLYILIIPKFSRHTREPFAAHQLKSTDLGHLYLCYHVCTFVCATRLYMASHLYFRLWHLDISL